MNTGEESTYLVAKQQQQGTEGGLSAVVEPFDLQHFNKYIMCNLRSHFDYGERII
ncbi:hypothetical protein P872_15735 [Rhodonellum psychrophilum GCM71 = DSM 17998]|uniref:Uncharacterized protein n=2 Tax=Rhodonellum TaxID=336827 RepID=U5C7Q0_9BACT|nr:MULTISPECIES: hypothetical protein [Rhodonellum]ERM84232.1 hypothetical protein P872_15735 [Rhodonellum psychrophilum GCM71 = DSM 17998]SDZ18651.1 hypothetical protein SAMN05444412_10788 [Rhodonellum ikkaensis]